MVLGKKLKVFIGTVGMMRGKKLIIFMVQLARSWVQLARKVKILWVIDSLSLPTVKKEVKSANMGSSIYANMGQFNYMVKT